MTSGIEVAQAVVEGTAYRSTSRVTGNNVRTATMPQAPLLAPMVNTMSATTGKKKREPAKDALLSGERGDRILIVSALVLLAFVTLLFILPCVL